MDGILAWGLDVIRWVQGIESPPLTAIMKAITSLGSEGAYLLLIPLVYWCVDEKKGLKLGVVFVLSSWLNGTLKDWWRQPRPFELDPKVGKAFESSYGLPSGHAQGSGTFWGMLAPWIRAPWGLILAIVIPLIIGFTRIYLGVHFPTDVFVGWLLAAAVLGAYAVFGNLVEAALEAASLRGRLLAVAVTSVLILVIHPEDPSFAGVLLGMGSGFALMMAKRPFVAALGADGEQAKVLTRALRFVVGMVGAALVYGGLKAIFPKEGAAQYALFRFLRYGLLGLWVSAGAPLLFMVLRLASHTPPRSDPTPS